VNESATGSADQSADASANEAVIRRWSAYPREEMEAMDADGGEGDFAKRHLINPTLLRMLGEVRGRRVLDAGCGQGYFSRMLAARGAEVVGVEPAEGMIGYAREREERLRQGIAYHRADLAQYDVHADFDAVVCSMVLAGIPDWRPAMRACVRALRPGGLFVFSLNHPAFEDLWATWRRHGEYRVRRYLAEYEIPLRHAPNFHRPLSAYLNELAALGCRLTELAEPGLDPAVAAAGAEGIEGYVHLPNFLIVAAEA
jgi:2-polyprenyl-3-methyl-5-hydroxy-6-metoxy-1,4-benzoquinol methylase